MGRSQIQGQWGMGKPFVMNSRGMYLMCNVYGFIFSIFLRLLLLFLEISPIVRVCCFIILFLDD